MQANPALSAWIDRQIGRAWRTDLDRLRDLEPAHKDAAAKAEFVQVKYANKQKLARTILDRTGIRVDPDFMFDVQVKRIHEYKRQLLHVLGVMDEYFRIVEDGIIPGAPRVHIFAGKAAPGYFRAKLIIKLVNNLADVINRDPKVSNYLKVVFLPDYKVSLAEVIIPAADLSEQISTAGLEASGTSNMKFALNGALTVGTLDGANVEMLEEVGADNIFIFGLRTPEVQRLRSEGYNPWDWYHRDPRIKRILDALGSDAFSANEPGIFQPIRRALLEEGDHYLHLADFGPYVAAQEKVSETFIDPALWSSKAILNVARMSKFSSDRTIREYAREIWSLPPIPIPSNS
jgi:starch phosphorylase